ncbi:MAG: alpha/beta fold hydrolase [Promethearchaeota archaeon]|nr:MAG: alpha/beta fold hydrolase [Candidatus Lokiarchaeota archaeon]
MKELDRERKRHKIFLLISILSLAFFYNLLYMNRNESYQRYDRINFESAGSTLWANLYYPSHDLDFQDDHPLIIWAHGLGGQRDIDVRIPIEFTKRGFYVVALDYHGHGESEGNILNLDPETEVPALAQDCSKLLDHLETMDFYNREINKDQIGIVGHSLGGAVALMNGALDDRFKVIVTWAALVNFDLEELGISQKKPLEPYIPVNLVSENNTENLLAFHHIDDPLLDYKKNALVLKDLADCELITVKETLIGGEHTLISDYVLKETIIWFENLFFSSHKSELNPIHLSYQWNYVLLIISFTFLISTILFIILNVADLLKWDKQTPSEPENSDKFSWKKKLLRTLEIIFFNGFFILTFWWFASNFSLNGLFLASVIILFLFIIQAVLRYYKKPKKERPQIYLKNKIRRQLTPNRIIFAICSAAIFLGFYIFFAICYPFAFVWPSHLIFFLLAMAVYPFYISLELFYRRIIYTHLDFIQDKGNKSLTMIGLIIINHIIIMSLISELFIVQSVLIAFFILLIVLILNTSIYKETHRVGTVILSSFLIVQIFFGALFSNILNINIDIIFFIAEQLP